MKTCFDCLPCLIRQTLDAARTLNLDDKKTGELLKQTLGLAQQFDWNLPPPVIARDIHRLIREITGDPDPYLSQKTAHMERALELLPEVEKAVADSEDPFLTAVKFSIAGNAMDLAAGTSVETDVYKLFKEALGHSIDRSAVIRFKETISTARDVLFLADNCGEIVFDRPLLEQIGAKVTVAVRGAPVINDATLADAGRSGLTDRFRVISNGADVPGTWLPECSEKFIMSFNYADLVVAKGQGNYETLSDAERSVFFLFLAKCPVVADGLGIQTNTFVIKET